MDGLFEIVFIALILLAPFLEGLLKRRKEGRSGDGEEGAGADRSASRTGTAGTDRRAPAEGTATSEGLIPAEIWEELTGFRPPPPPEEEAHAEVATAEVPVDDEVSWWEHREREDVAADAIGTEEIGGGRIRSDEIRPAGERGRTPFRREPTEVTAKQAELAARFEKAEARRAAPGGRGVVGGGVPGAPVRGGGRARRLLAGASRRRLQDAILLKEILDPPLALRPEGSGGAPDPGSGRPRPATSRPGPSS